MASNIILLIRQQVFSVKYSAFKKTIAAVKINIPTCKTWTPVYPHYIPYMWLSDYQTAFPHTIYYKHALKNIE